MLTKVFEENLGETVFCDLCNTDFTSSKAAGGLIFQSKAVCPVCTPKLMADIEKFGEQSFIVAANNDQLPFADFVRRFRGPDGGFIRVFTLDQTESNQMPTSEKSKWTNPILAEHTPDVSAPPLEKVVRILLIKMLSSEATPGVEQILDNFQTNYSQLLTAKIDKLEGEHGAGAKALLIFGKAIIDTLPLLCLMTCHPVKELAKRDFRVEFAKQLSTLCSYSIQEALGVDDEGKD